MLLSGEICLTRDRQETSKDLVNKCLGFLASSPRESKPMKTDSAHRGNSVGD